MKFKELKVVEFNNKIYIYALNEDDEMIFGGHNPETGDVEWSTFREFPAAETNS